MRRWSPDKITALILICSCLALIFSGINTEVKSILAMASAYLFGTSLIEGREARREKRKEESK